MPEQDDDILDGLADLDEDEVVEETEDEINTDESDEDEQDSIDETEGDDDSPEQGVVTEEIASKFPALKSYIGKPIEDAFKAYQSLASDYTKKSQELKSLKNAQQKNPEKEIEAEVNKLPDPMEDFEGYKKGLAKLLVKAGLTKSQEVEEVRQAIQQEQVKKKEAEVLNLLRDALPEGVYPERVIEEYVREYGEESKMFLASVANNDLKKFAKIIVDYHDRIADKDEKKAKSFSVASEVAKQLKKTKQAPIKPVVSGKKVKSNMSPAMMEIYERNVPAD